MGDNCWNRLLTTRVLCLLFVPLGKQVCPHFRVQVHVPSSTRLGTDSPGLCLHPAASAAQPPFRVGHLDTGLPSDERVLTVHRYLVSPIQTHAEETISFVGWKASPIYISYMWWIFKLQLHLPYCLSFSSSHLFISTQQPNIPRKSLKPALLQVVGELRGALERRASLSDIN